MGGRFDSLPYLADGMAVLLLLVALFLAVLAIRMMRLRARAEQALRQCEETIQQLNDDLGRLAYVVSHDLRAPMGNVRGFSDELKAAIEVIAPAAELGSASFAQDQKSTIRKLLSQEIPEAFHFIDESVSHMNRIIDAILTLSRLCRRKLEFKPLNMNELVKETLDRLALQISQRGVNLTVHKLPEIVADRTSMEQIMECLLTNAINYLDRDRPGEIGIGGMTLTDETVFHIRDNGVGIAEADLDKIFEVFHRGGNHDRPSLGMGLAYVRALVSRHQGRVWCESEPGAGATFTFTISSRLANEEETL
jgi:signal transduction histidine kinase